MDLNIRSPGAGSIEEGTSLDDVGAKKTAAEQLVLDVMPRRLQA
jgi:hypothetical protein